MLVLGAFHANFPPSVSSAKSVVNPVPSPPDPAGKTISIPRTMPDAAAAF